MLITMNSFGLILVSVLLGTAGQIFFKAGTRGLKIGFDLSMIRVFFAPYVMAGLVCYMLGSALFLKVLSQEELSWAYPMISLTYPLVLIFSYLVFKESIPLARWLGVLLIVVGVYFVGKR